MHRSQRNSGQKPLTNQTWHIGKGNRRKCLPLFLTWATEWVGACNLVRENSEQLCFGWVRGETFVRRPRWSCLNRKPANETLATSNIYRSLGSGTAETGGTNLKNYHPPWASKVLGKQNCILGEERAEPVCRLLWVLQGPSVRAPSWSPFPNYSAVRQLEERRYTEQVLNVHINSLRPSRSFGH